VYPVSFVIICRFVFCKLYTLKRLLQSYKHPEMMPYLQGQIVASSNVYFVTEDSIIISLVVNLSLFSSSSSSSSSDGSTSAVHII